MAPTPNANGSPTHGAVVIRAILGPVAVDIAEAIRRVSAAGVREFLPNDLQDCQGAIRIFRGDPLQAGSSGFTP